MGSILGSAIHDIGPVRLDYVMSMTPCTRIRILIIAFVDCLLMDHGLQPWSSSKQRNELWNDKEYYGGGTGTSTSQSVVR